MKNIPKQKKFLSIPRPGMPDIFDVYDGYHSAERFVCTHVVVNGAIRIAMKEHQVRLLLKFSPRDIV